MHEPDDNALLRQYAEQNSEAAFAALVARHLNKVYSVALRHTRNVHAAEEITQAVFVILAKKSSRLGGKVILSGWLYETARLTALTFIRSEIRRARREQEAHMQTALNEDADDAWPHIAPLLDHALTGLSAADRHAIVLRYFDGKSLGEVGAALGASEDAAKKRVTRAVEKLRGWFTKRGVTLTAAVLTAAISANSVQAAPLGLAKTISVVAIAKGATAGGSTLALVKGALKVMAWTKMKMAVAVGVGAVLVGTSVYQAQHAAKLREQNLALQQQQAEHLQQLQRERDDATNRLAGLLAENSRLRSNPDQTELLKLRGKVGVLQTKASQQAKSKKSILEIINSPEMRKMMKTTVAVSFDKVYAKLFADLKLTPEQVSNLKPIITDKMIAGIAGKGAMLSGQMTPDQIQQLNDQVNAEKAGLDGQIEQLLGADFAAYQDYEKTYVERSEIVGAAGFADQLTGSMELASDQTEQLVHAMADERRQFKFGVDYSDLNKYVGDMATMFSAENISQYQKETEQLNQLYLARAQTILRSDQQSVFQKFLSNRLAIQIMGLNMNAKMFGGKSSAN